MQRRAGFAAGSVESATSPAGSVDHLSPPSTSSRLSDSEPDPSDAGCSYDDVRGGDLLPLESGSTVGAIPGASSASGGAVGGPLAHHAHRQHRQHSVTRAPTAPPGVGISGGAVSSATSALVMERSVRSDGASVSSMGSSSRSVSFSFSFHPFFPSFLPSLLLFP